MEQIYTVASLWLTLAVISAIIAYHLRVSIALVEICVGVVTAAVASSLGVFEMLSSDSEWLRFLASSGAVLLTFLAGAELDPRVMRKKIREDAFWMRRLPPLTVGFLTPFYFLRAGTLVSLSALIATPVIFIILVGAKVASKIFASTPLSDFSGVTAMNGGIIP